MRIALSLLIAAIAPGFATSAIANDTLAGRYDMTGIAETGGELQLMPDGRYEWYASGDAVNRASKGRWVRAGDRITLTPDDPDNPSGIAQTVRVEPWNEDAERRYLTSSWSSEWDATLKRCPLLRAQRPAPPTADAIPPRDWKTVAREGLRTLSASRRTANAAIAEWARAREGTPEWDVRLKIASDALVAHESTVSTTDSAYEKAGLPLPVWEPLALPAKCTPPTQLPAWAPLPAARHPQIGIIVGDPSMAAALVGAQLRIRFTDGAQVDAVAGPGGWTMLPVETVRRIAAITIAFDYGDPGRATVLVDFAGPGVLVIDFNPAGVALGQLEPRTLLVARDGSLRAPDGQAGAYLKR